MFLRYKSRLKNSELKENKSGIAKQNTTKLPILPLHNICLSCIETNYFDMFS